MWFGGNKKNVTYEINIKHNKISEYYLDRWCENITVRFDTMSVLYEPASVRSGGTSDSWEILIAWFDATSALFDPISALFNNTTILFDNTDLTYNGTPALFEDINLI